MIEGTVLDDETKAPIGGVVDAYHTDQTCHCRNDGATEWSSENTPRLRGWMKTDSHGYFAWQTIRRAPYPNRDVPAHIHVTAWDAGYPAQWFQVEFAGDPLLSKQHFTDNTPGFL